MVDVLRSAALESPDAEALDDGGKTWTFAELDAAASRMARRLAPLGAETGTTLALVAHPGPLAVQAVFAASRLGATVAPLNVGLRPPEFEAAFDALGPDMILATRRAREASGLDPVWVTPLDDLPKPVEQGGGHDTPLPQPFAVLWTSGTDGRPHGVCLSSQAFDAVADASRDLLCSGPGARWYASLSLGHVGGLATVLRSVRHGATLVTRGRFDAKDLASLVDGGLVTHASLVPTMLERLLGERGRRPAPHTLKCLLVGGAHAPSSLVARALELGYPLALTYGMTETTSQVATASPSLVREKPGTVGRPLGGIEVRLAAEGEIQVRGPTLAVGYVGDVSPLTDAQGWYATGDLGRMDEDGHLWITGRCSGRLVTGGVNVDPIEVEEALRRVAGVADACVVGLDDAEWGDRVAALIVPDPMAQPDAGDVRKQLEAWLSPPKIPRMIRIAAELPQRPNGKVDRSAVHDLLTRQR
ncbi:MAG: class I adenylate-forming enzyme family protein [Gemmatimonadota bacterium]|nr:MAG: class I adenylate-forming enzyme family protein [Gemmatimonadota bacterium]